jgi:hypothetical protein
LFYRNLKAECSTLSVSNAGMPLLTAPWTRIRYGYFRAKAGQKKGFVEGGIGCLTGRLSAACAAIHTPVILRRR